MNQSSLPTFTLLLCSGILAGCEPASRDSGDRLTTIAPQNENTSLTTLASALPSATASAVSASVDSPPQPLFTISCDFGRAEPGQKFERTVEIVNPTGSPWTLTRIDSPCSCTVADADFTELAPGRREPLSLRYTAPRSTSDDHRLVRIWFAEHPQQSGLITLRSSVRRPLEVQSPTVEYGPVARDYSGERLLLVHNYSPARWDRITATSSVPWLQPVTSPAAPLDADSSETVTPAERWRGVVILDPTGLVPGEYHEQLTIAPASKVDIAIEPFVVPVSLTVRRPVTVIPGRFFLGRIQSGESKSARVTLRCAPGAELPAPLTVRNPYPELFQLEIKQTTPQIWTLDANFTAPTDAPVPEPFDLTLETKESDALNIPVYFSAESVSTSS
jgi:hypothetical protein